MYIPDRAIVRKLKAYDRHLFLQWNNEKGYFELYYDGIFKRELVTPVVQSIYDAKGKKEYAPLDERLIWWVQNADTWAASEDVHKTMKKRDSRELEFLRKQREIQKKNLYYASLDVAKGLNYEYVTRHAKKNKKGPRWNNAKKNKWVAPDRRVGQRIFKRSARNAAAYNYKI